MITAKFRLGRTTRGRFLFFCNDLKAGTPIWFKSWYPTDLWIVSALESKPLPANDPNEPNHEAVFISTPSDLTGHFPLFIFDSATGEQAGSFTVALTAEGGGDVRLGFAVRDGSGGPEVSVAQPIERDRAEAGEQLEVVFRPFGLFDSIKVREGRPSGRVVDCSHFFPGRITYPRIEEQHYAIASEPPQRPRGGVVVRMLQSGGTDHGDLILVP